jgi:Flp pilus assembly protein TadG
MTGSRKKSARSICVRAMAFSDKRGMAAVEFALILPLMLVIYLGLVELSRNLRTSQKLDLVAHTLSDLTAQRLTGGVNTGQAGMADSDFTTIFSAATALMSPLSTTNLKLTISEVKIVQSGSNYVAKVNWTAANSAAATLRNAKCASQLDALDVAPVSPTSMPTSYTTTVNGVAPSTGFVIVADVVYTYTPTVNFQFYKWNTTSAITVQRTAYAPVRNTYSPAHIQYRATASTTGANCQSPTL